MDEAQWSQHRETIWATVVSLVIGLALGYLFERLLVRKRLTAYLAERQRSRRQ